MGNIFYAHGVANNDVSDLTGIQRGSICTHQQLLVGGAEAAGGNIKASGSQYRSNVSNRQGIAAQLERINHNLELALAITGQRYVCHAWKRNKRRNYVLLYGARQRLFAEDVADNRETDNGFSVLVAFDYRELFNIIRQLTLYTVNSFANIRGSSIQISAWGKLNSDPSIILFTG